MIILEPKNKEDRDGYEFIDRKNISKIVPLTFRHLYRCYILLKDMSKNKEGYANSREKAIVLLKQTAMYYAFTLCFYMSIICYIISMIFTSSWVLRNTDILLLIITAPILYHRKRIMYQYMCIAIYDYQIAMVDDIIAILEADVASHEG